MFHFWNACLQPLLHALEPAVIVEIGSEEGWTTEKLLEHCRASGARLHVIDPQPISRSDVAEALRAYGCHHQKRSLEVLPELESADLYLIDGDHNWFTVHAELQEIVRRPVAENGRLPVIVLHDVGWPYGRRDMYYDPSTVPDDHRQPHARDGMRPERSALEGAFNNSYDNARTAGGPRNGVLTAVEDFMHEHDGLYAMKEMPGFHGLALLRPKLGLDSAIAADLDAVFSVPTRLRGLIEELERQRIDALVRLAECKSAARA